MKMCLRCQANPIAQNKQLCPACKKESRSTRLNQNRLQKLAHKKPVCEHCGFVALHPCQLDVDHIDGNRDNNHPSNYRTLCANCHRLKTYVERDHIAYEQDPVLSPQLRLIK